MKSSPVPERVRYLVDAYCTDGTDAKELRELETVLEGDERARRFFAAYCRMHAGLLFASRAECAVRLARGSASPPPVAAPVFGPLTDAWQGTVSYFSQIGPLSYLLAVVITGAMLLGFRAYKITHHQHIAEAPSQSVPSNARPEMVLVGRITGMVDVKWSDDPRYLPPPGFAHVPLGRKYILDSGLLEITYDSGAKVILEGPCTYEVESTGGGYLALGKLTARVEERREKREERSRTVDSMSSFILHPSSLFSVRTPTAVVTDLGTEFGVEVTENGGCEVHLIQGKVLARRIGSASVPNGEVELSSSEDAVRFDPDRADIVFISPAPERFLSMRAGLKRKLRSRWPIGDKTLAAWVSLANLTQRGRGVISIENYWTNEFDGIGFAELTSRKWMAASDYFRRAGRGLNNLGKENQKWMDSNDYRRSAQRDQLQYPDETAGPGQFVQIAIVYEQTRVTIYRDGKVYVEYETDGQQTFSKSSVVLIGKGCMDRDWLIPPLLYLSTLAGKIEEARLYDVSLSAEMIAVLKPNQPSPIDPMGQWTFEDGTARDSMGCFPPGELHGAAHIADGKLILDGADSYLFVPSPLNRNAKPAAEADAPGPASQPGKRKRMKLLFDSEGA